MTMDHKTRMRATLAGEPVDRVAVSTWGHDFLREWTAEELAAHTIERQRTYDYDFVKINPRWTLFAEPWGNRYEPPTEQRFPRLTHRIVEGPEDLPRIPAVDASNPPFDEHVDAMARIHAALCAEVDLIATVFSPLAVVGLLFCELDPQRFENEITNVIRSLEARQKPFGGWGYPQPQTNWEYGDTSMTQYAVLCAWLAKIRARRKFISNPCVR